MIRIAEARFPYVISTPIYKTQTILSEEKCIISLYVQPTRVLEQQIPPLALM